MTEECIWGNYSHCGVRILSRVRLWMEASVCQSPGITGLSQDDVMTLAALVVQRHCESQAPTRQTEASLTNPRSG